CNDPATTPIARLIIQIAKDGQRDPALADRATRIVRGFAPPRGSAADDASIYIMAASSGWRLTHSSHSTIILGRGEAWPVRNCSDATRIQTCPRARFKASPRASRS